MSDFIERVTKCICKERGVLWARDVHKAEAKALVSIAKLEGWDFSQPDAADQIVHDYFAGEFTAGERP